VSATVEQLDAQAIVMSDNNAAQRLNDARAILFTKGKLPLFAAILSSIFVFFLYAATNASIFHFRKIHRPLVLLTLTFPPFFLFQYLLALVCANHLVAKNIIGYDLDTVIVLILPVFFFIFFYLCYLQFYSLVEFSITFRILDHFLKAENHSLSFEEVRRLYPFEEIISRKLQAAGKMGLLVNEKENEQLYISNAPIGTLVGRVVFKIKTFCNWGEGG